MRTKGEVGDRDKKVGRRYITIYAVVRLESAEY